MELPARITIGPVKSHDGGVKTRRSDGEQAAWRAQLLEIERQLMCTDSSLYVPALHVVTNAVPADCMAEDARPDGLAKVAVKTPCIAEQAN